MSDPRDQAKVSFPTLTETRSTSNTPALLDIACPKAEFSPESNRGGNDEMIGGAEIPGVAPGDRTPSCTVGPVASNAQAIEL